MVLKHCPRQLESNPQGIIAKVPLHHASTLVLFLPLSQVYTATCLCDGRQTSILFALVSSFFFFFFFVLKPCVCMCMYMTALVSNAVSETCNQHGGTNPVMLDLRDVCCSRVHFDAFQQQNCQILTDVHSSVQG